MNQFYRILILAAFVAIACSREVIDDDDMPKILADIYMTDRAILNNPMSIRGTDSSRVYESLLNRYGYKTEDLTYTFDYYLPRPTKLKTYFTEAKAILENREKQVNDKISAIKHRDSLLSPVKKIIDEPDSLKDIDSYIRSLRWILSPEKHPDWHLFMADSIQKRYEMPLLTKWWINNLSEKQNSFLKYEKNSRPIYLPLDKPANPERLSLPEH